MNDNTLVLLAGEVGLIILGVAGLSYGQITLAGVAVGAFAGLLAGHLNGRQTNASP